VAIAVAYPRRPDTPPPNTEWLGLRSGSRDLLERDHE